ncbi:MAG: DUF5723 family protein [Ignavibacteria bacterium]
MEKLVYVLIILISFTYELNAQNFYDVRSLSMGKTDVSNSYELGAFNSNPANIVRQRSNNNASAYFSLFTNLNLVINSEFFSVDFYNKYFTKNSSLNPVLLTDQDKTDIVGKAGSNPINFTGYFREFAIVINKPKFGAIGISLDERFSGNFAVSRDILDLGLFGNEINRLYNFVGTRVEGSWVRQMNLTYANYLNVKGNKTFESFSYGVSVKPQFGMYYLTTKKNNLTLTTNKNFEVEGNGEIELLYSGISDNNKIVNSLSPAGFGFGFDAGINAGIKNFSKNGELNIGVSINDIGYINWYKNAYSYFYNGNYIVTDITDPDQLDSLDKIIKGTKTLLRNFNTALPANLRIGLTYKLFPGKVKNPSKANSLETANFSLEYIQGFSDKFGSTKDPVVGIGSEVNLGNIFSPRIGFGFGGREKFVMGLGIGINTVPVIIDLGTYNVSSIFNPKGTGKISGGLSIKFKIN